MSRQRGYTGTHCNYIIDEQELPEDPESNEEDPQFVLMPIYCGNLSTMWDDHGTGWCDEHAPVEEGNE